MRDRSNRIEARAARREARAARRNSARIDSTNKSAYSSLRDIRQKAIDMNNDEAKETANKTIGTTVDKVIDKGTETISKAFDEGIKKVSDWFDKEEDSENYSHEETSSENYSDVAPFNRKCCAKCKSKNIWVPAEYNIRHEEGDADNEPTESWLVGCYDCGYYDVCIWNKEVTEIVELYEGYQYVQRANDVENGKASQANIDDFISRNLTDDDLYVDESTIQYNSNDPSSNSDNTVGTWLGCAFWIFIIFLVIGIFS